MLALDWNGQMRAHGRTVVLRVVAMGVRLERAEEIAQTAWSRIMEKHQSGQLEHLVLPGVVIAQARFLALDELRRPEPELVPDHPIVVIDGGPNPEQTLLARRELHRALDALAECPPRAQQIFRAVYESDRPHQEIADELGVSLQRVRQTLCEVRKRLRAALEESS